MWGGAHTRTYGTPISQSRGIPQGCLGVSSTPHLVYRMESQRRYQIWVTIWLCQPSMRLTSCLWRCWWRVVP